MQSISSIGELIKAAEELKCKISEVVINQQISEMEQPREKLIELMGKNLATMKSSIKSGLRSDLKSPSGLSGGNSSKIYERAKGEENIICSSLTRALSYSVAVAEYNACMGKIVAAPTAGSCGIIPAILITIAELHNKSDEELVKALFTAAGFGIVIAKNGSISGAEGGCQAECGSAAAMAAAAAVELMGGNPVMAGHACALTIQNSMGLVCDPVAGLVEVPCVMRNAGATANALAAAEMALSGVESVIPVDEVIEAMKNVGISMSHTLKETALGGIAATKTGKRLQAEIFGKKEKHL